MSRYDIEREWKARGLGTRAARNLAVNSITTVEQLAEVTDAVLMRSPNFGARSLAEVHRLLASEGYDRLYSERCAAVHERVRGFLGQIELLVEQRTWAVGRAAESVEHHAQRTLDVWKYNDRIEAEKRKLLDFVWENSR